MRVLRFSFSLAVLAAAVILPVHADDLQIKNPNQADFNSVARDVTAAFDYRALGPAAATGITGISVGGFASITPVRDRGAFQRLTGHDTSILTVGGINATKGLPYGIDVGAFVAGVSGTSAALYGAQLRYALLEGTALTPAVALRGSYTGASGINDFDYHSYGADVSISQPLLLLTPYAGVGYVWGHLSPHDGLNNTSVTRPKGFVGLRFSLLGLLQVTGEYERLGSDNIYSARLGVSL